MKLLFALSVLVAATIAENQYVVIAPSKIRANMDLSISVNILKGRRNVNVKAILLQGNTEIVSCTGVFRAARPGNLHMKIPATLSSSYYTLKVVGSGGLSFTDQRSLSVNKKTQSSFIQISKAIFKPGEKVNFRVFSVYPDLTGVPDPVDIFVYDAQGNRIKQWLKEEPQNGVIRNSIRLSTQPVLGDWKIQLKTSCDTIEKVFEVAEYVLPKFEVQVAMPSYVVANEKEVTFTVKAKYTYGKPVSGKANVHVSLEYNYNYYGGPTRAEFLSTVVESFNGETKVTISMDTVRQLSHSLNKAVLKASVDVTEILTGNVMSGNGQVTIYNRGYKMEFPKTNPETFKPGLKYYAYLKISQQDDLPPVISSTKVTATIVVKVKDDSPTPYQYYYNSYTPRTKISKTFNLDFSVPNNGLVAIPVDIPGDAYTVTITANYNSIRSQLSLKKSYSPSDTYIQLTLKSTGAIQAGSPINFEARGTEPLESLVYQVLSRGAIVQTGTVPGSFHASTILFSVTSSSDMAPNARIVVYYVRTDGEIVTDSMSFDIQGAFNNKVDISFNNDTAEPGSKVWFTVKADPNSEAHLLAIDQSVLLLRSGNDVSTDDVYSELKAYDTIKDKTDGIMPFRLRRSIWWPFPICYGGNDATKIFENAGVVVLTDALLYKYQEPTHILYPMLESVGGHGLFDVASKIENVLDFIPAISQNVQTAQTDKAPVEKPSRVRTNFAESWLFEMVNISDSGFATVESTVPDTITSWVASAFAFNSKIELGMAPNQANLRVFRPFFVTLNLPYSVINGEQLALQAIVFNYLNDDAQVRVTLAQSKSFSVLAEEHGLEVLKQEDSVQDVLIKAGEGMSVFFPIVPHELGKIDIEVKAQTTRAADAVRKQLLVEPEGVAKEFNIPVLVELTKETPSFTKIVDLSMPPNVVPGSELMRISAVGDLMGPSIAGLDALLRMPTGCGEQTLLGLAPDVYITDYLSAVNKLHGDIADKALSFMESGYQRELTYKHDDHSFSAFGNNDPSGSMWLTAFVVKVFHQASSHIYVDDNVIIRAINWIINKQNHDGSFPEPGRVIHKNMQGKAGSGTALSLFVFIALLENQDLFKTGSYATKFQSARTNALAYLETQMEHDDDLYNLALASYAFTLAGSSKAQDIITRLNHEATEEDGLKYWHYPETPTTSNPGSWHRPHPTKAIDTEITGYALLTYALCHDLIGGKRIMQWLVQQRNPQGGFVSTQDTVIALNALSEFNRQVYSDNFQVSITTTFNVFQRFRFNIDKTNSLVLQSKDTTRVPSSVKIEARGSGVALVNLAVFFNVLQEVEETFFDLKLSMDDESLNHFSLTVCACWLGEGSASGMAVAEVGVPSGFSVDPDLISDNKLLKRIEVEDRKVILYFDEIGTDDMCLTLTAERSGMVAKCKKAPVVVYDYYEPSNQVTGFYESKLLKDSKLCDVCKECKGCQDRLQDKRVEFLDFELERV